MSKETDDQGTSRSDVITEADAQPKKPFLEPKLAFIEPKLTKHGDVTKITQQGFFGTFTP